MKDTGALIIIRLHPGQGTDFKTIVSIDPVFVSDEIPSILKHIARQIEKPSTKYAPIVVHTIEEPS